MRMKRLGKTDLQISAVGLGAWAMGGPWLFGWGPQDDKDSLEAIFEAMDCGINWIDTAAIYGHGRSEWIIGHALREMKRKPLIFTKCGLCWDEKSERIPRLKRQSIMQECEDSLHRLGVEAIDLYQIHYNQPPEDIEEAWATMADLKQQGKVRHIGLSNYAVEQMQQLEKIETVETLQPPYSMLRRDFEQGLADYCKKNDIGVIIYSPMQRGLLTGKFTAEKVAALPPGDSRRTNPDFTEPRFSVTLKLIEKLKPLAARHGRTTGQLAVAWTLANPAVSAAIVGARRKGQIAETAQAANWQLTESELNEIEKYLQEWQKEIEK